MTTPITVAAAGSCISRDPFNSQFNPDYKKHFKFTAYQFQASIISLMAPPAICDMRKYKWDQDVTGNTHWHFKTELNKSFLNEVYMSQPEYLILDFYGDVLYGVVEFENTLILNKKHQLKDNELFKESLGKEYSYFQNQNDYFEMFKKAFDQFMTFCRHYLPHTKVVINCGHFETKYRDENGEIKLIDTHPQSYYDELNDFWNMLNRYAIDNYHLEALTFYDKQYYATNDYPFGGLYPLHFEKEIYHDFQDKLLAITKQHIRQPAPTPPAYNFIQNPTFQLNTCSWTGFYLPVFKVNPEGGLTVWEQGNQKNEYYQLRSEAIPVEPHRDYILSFEFNGKDLTELKDDDNILVLRTFNNRHHFSYKESEWEEKIMKKEVVQYLKKYKTNRFEKVITPHTGRYLKVIPYLRQNGYYELNHLEFSTEALHGKYRYPLNEALQLEKEN